MSTMAEPRGTRLEWWWLFDHPVAFWSLVVFLAVMAITGLAVGAYYWRQINRGGHAAEVLVHGPIVVERTTQSRLGWR